MQQIISGFLTVYCFARWEDSSDFTFLGIGKVLSFTDGVEVYNSDGNRTHSIEFTLSCKTENTHSFLINNFDESFEEGLLSLKPEGAVRYKQHKTRERNGEIVKKKKKEFKEEHDSLFCEVCLFDFSKTYGERGNDFIECHHNVPLHVETNERVTRTTDLSLLCSNCHRMIHRLKNWLTVDELKQLYKRHV